MVNCLGVSILLMLDNNLSPISQLFPIHSEIMFQSFLCWIIIYHPYLLRDITTDIQTVSILLMLDNNLSPFVVKYFTELTGLVSILLMLDNNLSPKFIHIPVTHSIIVSILLMLDNNLSLNA